MSKSKGGGKLIPELNQASGGANLQNLTGLRMIDPFIEKILATASNVVAYEFNIAVNQWCLKDVEGTLFVVKRKVQPQFQLMVLDRSNGGNYNQRILSEEVVLKRDHCDVMVESVLPGFDLEVAVPYLLYQNAKFEINGIRFTNEGECEVVALAFTRILDEYSRVSQQAMISLSKVNWFCDGWIVPWNYLNNYYRVHAAQTKVVKDDDPLETSSSINASDDLDGGYIDEPDEEDAIFAYAFSKL